MLIKVVYSAVNQYDKILMEQKHDENYILGAEGSGIIEEVGAGVDESLKGRKVAFCHTGWSQFATKRADDILFLDDSVDLKLAADSIVNPTSALCLMKQIREQKSDFVVIDGASSSLGRMLIQLLQKENIDFLALVLD